MVYVIRRSEYSGKTSSMSINITRAMLQEWYSKGGSLKKIAPCLTKIEEYFILYGVTRDEIARFEVENRREVDYVTT